MDSAIHSASAKQRGIGCVHDRIDFQLGDICLVRGYSVPDRHKGIVPQDYSDCHGSTVLSFELLAPPLLTQNPKLKTVKAEFGWFEV